MIGEIYKNYYYKIPWILRNPRQIYLNVKWWIQRRVRGYSDPNVWNANNYLGEVIYKHLIRFKGLNRMGWPGEPLTPEQWEEIIDKMIWSFKHASMDFESKEYLDAIDKAFEKSNIKNGTLVGPDGHFRSMELFDESLEERAFEIYKEDAKRYEEGMKLFAEYFTSLWD